MHRFESPEATFAQEISDGNTKRVAENAIKKVRNSILNSPSTCKGDTAFCARNEKEKKAATLTSNSLQNKQLTKTINKKTKYIT